MSFGDVAMGENRVIRKVRGNNVVENQKSATDVAGNRARSDLLPLTAGGSAKIVKLTEWDRQLWAMLGRLRGSYDVGPYLEAVLELLCLRVLQPDLWQRLLGEVNASAARTLLAHADSIADPHMVRVPIVEAIFEVPQDDRTLVEMIHALNGVDLSDTGGAPSDVAQFVDHLLALFERSTGHRGGEYFTPGSLVRCMVGLVEPRPGEHVYDPFCRSGELLAAAVMHMGSRGGEPVPLSVSGQAWNERFWRLTKLSAALHRADVDLGPSSSNTLHGDVHPGRRFNVVLANPPFNMSDWARNGDVDRRWPYGTPPERNANFAWLQHVVSKLSPGGRAAVLMSNTTTTAGSTAEESIRARMVDAGVIDCVVALPARLFRSTGIPVSLWLLRSDDEGGKAPPEILLINATSMGTMIDRVQRVLTDENLDQICREYHAWRDRCSADNYQATAGFARSVGHPEVQERDYVLNPRVYVESTVAEIHLEDSLEGINDLCAALNDLRSRSRATRAALDAKLAGIVVGRLPSDAAHEGWTEVRLGEACDLLAGPGTIRRGEYQPSWVPVVLPRNIKYNRISGDELDAVAPQGAAKLSRYRLAPGDIICTRTGTLGRYGLVQPEQANWMLGPGCIRLRPAQHVDPRYLTYYLNSPVACAWLTSNATGSAILHINTKTLGLMPLALPPLAVQSEIGAILGSLDSEIALESQISASTQALRDLLLPLLMMRRSAGAAS